MNKVVPKNTMMASVRRPVKKIQDKARKASGLFHLISSPSTPDRREKDFVRLLLRPPRELFSCIPSTND
jgi:hypothetical protein